MIIGAAHAMNNLVIFIDERGLVTMETFPWHGMNKCHSECREPETQVHTTTVPPYCDIYDQQQTVVCLCRLLAT